MAVLSPQEALPGFATAFDEGAMKGYLQRALFGARTALNEAIALLRVALRSQHDFDETRREIASSLLEERMS